MSSDNQDSLSPDKDTEIWGLIDLCADYYWQESANYHCLSIRCGKKPQGEDQTLLALQGSTLWDIGCLVTGRGQSWRQHLTDRKMQQDFKDLICKLPSKKKK